MDQQQWLDQFWWERALVETPSLPLWLLLSSPIVEALKRLRTEMGQHPLNEPFCLLYIWMPHPQLKFSVGHQSETQKSAHFLLCLWIYLYVSSLELLFSMSPTQLGSEVYDFLLKSTFSCISSWWQYNEPGKWPLHESTYLLDNCWKNFTSVRFSGSVVYDSLRPHESQHARPPCPSPTPGVHSDSCPSSQ